MAWSLVGRRTEKRKLATRCEGSHSLPCLKVAQPGRYDLRPGGQVFGEKQPRSGRSRSVAIDPEQTLQRVPTLGTPIDRRRDPGLMTGPELQRQSPATSTYHSVI
jgi:hypothetical protein